MDGGGREGEGLNFSGSRKIDYVRCFWDWFLECKDFVFCFFELEEIFSLVNRNVESIFYLFLVFICN